MGPRVLLQIAESGEMFITVFAIERLSVVQSQMGPQAIPRVEGLLAGLLGALERLLFGVDADVDLEAVRGEKGLAATILRAFETVFAWRMREDWDAYLLILQ